MGNKGEEIRGALDEGGMRATMFTKEERREGEEGSGVGRGMGVKSRPDAGKRRNAQCTKTVSAARCRGHARTGS